MTEPHHHMRIAARVEARDFPPDIEDGRVRKAAVGFYWTLPVPWAGFESLPRDVDAAADASLTIAYQREVTRRYAKDNDHHLIHEEVFLEINPDRGSSLIDEPLMRMQKLCEDRNATLLLVDFEAVGQWRRHKRIDGWIEHTSVDCVRIYPEETRISGDRFDPFRHFADWRQRQEEWSDTKSDRRDRALSRALELRADLHPYPWIAATLNNEGILSPTGRTWTGDNVRKLIGPPKSE